MKSAEVCIIGAGIAGASVAYFLANQGLGDIIILEKEETAGYHATGRSAAALVRISTHEVFMVLSVMSTPFLTSPPEGFSEVPLLKQNGSLVVGMGRRWHLFRLYCTLAKRLGLGSRKLSPSEAAEKVPALDHRFIDSGIFFPEDGLLDVHALLWGYLHGAQKRGARICFRNEVTAINFRNRSVHSVVTSETTIRCRMVINAAGAWANHIAGCAGIRSLPLTAYRRHLVLCRPRSGSLIGDWPMTHHYSLHFYFRPESGALLASPMDQDPMEPCDVSTDELRIAQTADLLSRYTPAIAPERIIRSWAGLRTRTPDCVPIVGYDPRLNGFFWLAGQGGHGIHTSPALGMIAAQLVTMGATELFDHKLLSPGRFLSGIGSKPAIGIRRVVCFLKRLLDSSPRADTVQSRQP